MLVDIQGVEDHFGDMDLKIAGTSSGITAIQLDVKPAGIPLQVHWQNLHLLKPGGIETLGYRFFSLVSYTGYNRCVGACVRCP